MKNAIETMKNAIESTSPSLKQAYQTTDLTLTSFLRCRGFQIENIKQNNGRTLFSFQESPELRLAILEFANDAVVAVRSFCSTMRDLKALTRVLVFFVAAVVGLQPVLAQQKRAPHDNSRTPASQATYSCPMHPEVTSKKKGRCPKCKMDLRLVDQKKDAVSETAVAQNETGAIQKMNIPDLELVDQDGRKIHFYTDLIKGQTVAINFIFTTCTTICPPLGATFARVQRELGDKVGRDVRFISISVDPATDTPERLKAWGEKFHAGEGWTFVTGNKPQVDELLRALGASSARREDHSPTVLIGNDTRGAWTRTYGLTKSSQLVQIINDAIAGRSTATDVEVSN